MGKTFVAVVLTVDQQALVHQHMGLAHWHANRFRSALVEPDDKDQVARRGLCEAAARFKGDLRDFARYASVWIHNLLKREHNSRVRLRAGDQLSYELGQLYSERWLWQRADAADKARVLPRHVAFREERMRA